MEQFIVQCQRSDVSVKKGNFHCEYLHFYKVLNVKDNFSNPDMVLFEVSGFFNQVKLVLSSKLNKKFLLQHGHFWFEAK